MNGIRQHDVEKSFCVVCVPTVRVDPRGYNQSFSISLPGVTG